MLTLKENFEKWKTTTIEEKEDCLNFMIVILNIKVTDDEEQDALNRQMLLINDQITRFHSNYTAKEIKEAMRLYVAKKLNIKIFRLIDSIAISEILEAYNLHRHRLTDDFVKERKMLIEKPIEKSEHEKKKIFDDFVKMVYEEVLEKGYCPEAWYIFKKLEDNKKIEISNEEKTKLYKKELAIYVPEERQRIIKQNPLNGKHLVKEFEKTYEGKKRPVYVQNRCRSILVSTFIKESIKSLEELNNCLW